MRIVAPLTERPGAWNKILCIQSAFDAGCEFVMWVDADATIMKAAMGADIRDAIDRAHDFFLVRHAIGDGYGPNTGILIVRNSPAARAALDAIWNMTQYEDHPWWEQAAFLDYFGLIDELPSQDKKLFTDRVRPEPSGHSDALVQNGDPASIKWIDL